MASLVPCYHNNISCCTAYLVSLQILLADPVVLSVISVSRSGSTGSLVSTDYLMVAFLYPRAISVTLGGSIGTLVTIQYLCVAPLVH